MTIRKVSRPRCLFILLDHDLRVCANGEGLMRVRTAVWTEECRSGCDRAWR